MYNYALVDVSVEVHVVNENVNGKGVVEQEEIMLAIAMNVKEKENMKDSPLHQLLPVAVVDYKVFQGYLHILKLNFSCFPILCESKKASYGERTYQVDVPVGGPCLE